MATVAAATVTATAFGASAASAAPKAGDKGPDKANRAPLIGTAKPTAIDGRYIVVLNDRATTADTKDARAVAKAHGGKILENYGKVLNGFSPSSPTAPSPSCAPAPTSPSSRLTSGSASTPPSRPPPGAWTASTSATRR